MQYRYMASSAVVLSLLACSACAPAGEHALASRSLPAGGGPSVAAAVEHGLPGLPAASGSSGSDGTYGPVPAEAKRVLIKLGCRLDDTAKARVIHVPNADGRQDFMVTDDSGSAYHYWLRSFSGSGDTTGYLLQLQGCPASTAGMRAYIAHGSAAPQDVTASVLAYSALPDTGTMAAYAEVGVSELFALIEQLNTVPVLRWVAEPDPDRPIDEDARTVDHGNFVHGGFLVWEKDRFTYHWRIPASLWPCRRYPTIPCSHDPFVKGP